MRSEKALQRGTATAATLWAVMLFIGSGAAAERQLTPLEKGLQGWLWERKMPVRVGVATKAQVSSVVALNTRSGNRTLVTLYTDVDSRGNVSFSGRDLLGLKRSVPSRQVTEWIRGGSVVQVLGFRFKEDLLAFDVVEDRSGRKGTLRLSMSPGFAGRMTVQDIIHRLTRVFDFGSDLERLEARARELRRARDEVESATTAYGQTGSELDQTERQATELAAALRDGIEAHDRFAEVLGVPSAERERWRTRLTSVESEIESYQRVLAANRGRELDSEFDALGVQLVTRDESLRGAVDEVQQIAEGDELLELLRRALENRREAGELKKLKPTVLEPIHETIDILSEWSSGAQAARQQECQRDGPLDLLTITRLIQVLPDPSVAALVERCGVTFPAEGDPLRALEAAGLGPTSALALRAPDARRVPLDAVPSVRELLQDVQARFVSASDEEEPVLDSRFVRSGDQVIRDQATGLSWSRSAGSQRLSWQEAGSYCKRLRLGGSSGWRLPELTELEELDRQVSIRGGWVVTGFQSGIRDAWSGSKKDRKSVWFFDFNSRLRAWGEGRKDRRFVLCVR